MRLINQLFLYFHGTSCFAGMHVRSGVADFVPDASKHYRKPDISIDMSMDAWTGYYVGDITPGDLLTREDDEPSNKEKVRAFFSLFDQVHPSKTALIAPSATR